MMERAVAGNKCTAAAESHDGERWLVPAAVATTSRRTREIHDDDRRSPHSVDYCYHPVIIACMWRPANRPLCSPGCSHGRGPATLARRRLWSWRSAAAVCSISRWCRGSGWPLRHLHIGGQQERMVLIKVIFINRNQVRAIWREEGGEMINLFAIRLFLSPTWIIIQGAHDTFTLW